MPSRSARRATGIVSAATLAVAAGLFSSNTFAAPYEWKSATGGTYSVLANWNRTDGNPTTTLPTVGDTVTFNVPQIFTVTLVGSVAADVLNFNSGAVTFASTGGQKNFLLNSGLAQANLTNGTLTLGISGGAVTLNASNLTLSSGATLQSKFGSDVISSNLKIGTTASPSASTFTVDGVNSSLNVTGPVTVAANSANGNLNVLNQATATVSGAITLGDDTSVGSLTVQSSSTLTSGSLSLGATPSATGHASLLVDTSSTVTLSGAATFTLGAASGPTSTATINNSIFRTGTGLTTINPTGSLKVTGTTASFTVNGDLLVAGPASFAANSLNVAVGKTVTINTGGSLSLSNAFATNTSTVFHIAGGTMTSTPLNTGDDTTLTLGAGSSLDVTAGGKLAPHAIAIGAGGTSSLIVDGPGSSLDATGSPYSSGIGTGSGTGTLTVRNGATAGFDNTLFVGSLGAAANGTLNVQSGATVFAYGMALADSATGTSRATVNVTGAGSALVLSGPLTAGTLTSTINVTSGATLVQGDTTMTPIGVPIGQGTSQLARGLTLTINGGFVSLGNLLADPGVVTITSGSLGFAGNLNVDSTGLLGFTVNLGPQQAVALTGSTTVGVGGLLALSGGALSTASLANFGTFNFTSGTLALTGPAGLAVSSAGPLGATPNLGTGKNLIVSNTTTVSSTSSLAVTGGSLTTENLTNAGSITVNNYGALTVNSTLTNSSTGRLFIGPDLIATADGAASNVGRITLQGGSTRIVGTAPLTNTGLITGGGEIAKPLLNSAGGELRAEPNKALLISGPAVTNNGKLNLTGGTLEFSDALTNSPTGTLLGRGTLIANAGLTNNGQASFSGGLADVYGPVANNAKIVVTGGATTTFYDPVTNNTGADIFTAANSSTVFMQPVTGSGTFSGPGTKYFSDGSSSMAALEASGVTVVSESACLSTGDFVEQSVTVNGLLTTTSPSRPSQTQSLTIGPSGQLDLTTNTLILDYTDSATFAPAGLATDSSSLSTQNSALSTSAAIAQLRQYLRTSQLTSSTATSNPNHLHALGYIDTTLLTPEAASQLAAGLPIDSSSLLVKLTLIGDANLDGKLNADDYALLDRGFAKYLSTWTFGDFNYDGQVTSADYLLIDTTLGKSQGLSPTFLATRESQFGADYVSQLLTSIPEPSSLACLFAGLFPLARRRRQS